MYNKSRDLYSFFKVIFLAFIVAFVLCLIEDVRAFIENIEAFMDMGKISKMVAFIRFGADTSIEIVNIVIIICAYGLVKAFKKDGFSKKVIEEAERLKRFTVGGLTVIVLLEFVCNIIQVFARSAIDSVRMIFTFPIANILIIFIIILITKYISVTKEIKEENEMFI